MGSAAPRVFIDTSALAAMTIGRDTNHAAARAFLEVLREDPSSVSTTNMVLAETYSLLRARLGLPAVVSFHEQLWRSKMLRVYTAEPVVEAEAWRIFSTYEDKDFGFVDCVSFAVMQVLRIDRAFTFDKHFAQFGFEMVP